MIKSLLLSGTLMVLVTFYSNAQLTFQKTIGGPANDWSRCIIPAIDGGYLIVGETTGFGVSGSDGYVVKSDVNGVVLWTKTIGSFGTDFIHDIKAISDTGYVAVGSIYSNSASNYVMWLAKLDISGDTIWTLSFGTVNSGQGKSVQETSDGGYIAAGITGNVGGLFLNFYLIKTDVNGNVLWDKSIGGGGTDHPWSIKQTNDGGYIVCGSSDSFLGNTNVLLVKTDSLGNLLWSKTFGGTDLEFSYSVLQTNDGGYIVAGKTKSFGAGAYDVYLIKTDSSGNLQWSKSYGGANDDLANNVQQTVDGGYILTGLSLSFSSSANVYAIKTDSLGIVQWSKAYGGSGADGGYSSKETVDGGYIFSGYTWSYGLTDADIYLIKTDAIGNAGCNTTTPATITGNPTYAGISQTLTASSVGSLHTAIITVGNGGIDSMLCTTVGINNIELNNIFAVSPNPTNGSFTINFNRTITKGEIDIYNSLGKIVYSNALNNEKSMVLILGNLLDGLYFVKVFDGEKSYCKKLIVEHD